MPTCTLAYHVTRQDYRQRLPTKEQLSVWHWWYWTVKQRRRAFVGETPERGVECWCSGEPAQSKTDGRFSRQLHGPPSACHGKHFWCHKKTSLPRLRVIFRDSVLTLNLSIYLILCVSIYTHIKWGFLAWYMLVVALCWSSLQSKPFLDACVIMLLVGFVLNANAFVSFQHHIWDCPNSRFDPTLAVYMRRQATSAVRLFVIPYCVSCYSGIANSTPGFFSIFPVKISVLIPVAIGAVAFPICLRLASDMTSRAVYPKESNVERNRRRSTTMVAVRFWVAFQPSMRTTVENKYDYYAYK